MNQPIKVITIYQPHATLHAAGIKANETRPSATSHRGTYLIHAAKGFPEANKALCETEPFKSELARLGFASWRDLPTGAIVGSVEYTNCKQIDLASNYRAKYLKEHGNTHELVFGDYSTNRTVWYGNNHRQFPTPIPYTGGQGYYRPFKVDMIQDKANSFALIDKIKGEIWDETSRQLEEITQIAIQANPAFQEALDSPKKAIVIGRKGALLEYDFMAYLAENKRFAILENDHADVPPNTIGIVLQDEAPIKRPMPLVFPVMPKIETHRFDNRTKKQKRAWKQKNERFSQRKFKSLTNGK